MSISDIAGLQCLCCGRIHGTDVADMCPHCGPEGILDVRFDYRRIRESLHGRPLGSREPGLWRYLELLPVDADAARPPLRAGGTPLMDVPRLAAFVGARRLQVKDEGQNPTGSLKDRASAVAVMKAVAGGFHVMAGASTGNAASSLAAFAAGMGLRAHAFLPWWAPEWSVKDCRLYGATVVRVRGTYADACELCNQACSAWGWYNRNPGANPYLLEGGKTAGHEIAEESQDETPEWVAVPVGDGVAIAAIWKGLQEMHHLGILPRRPRLLGVQAETVAPVVAAFRSGRDPEPQEGDTIAAGIRVARPAEWRRAVRAVQESGGTLVAVSDGEIADGVRAVARLTGMLLDPAAAAAIAGVRRAIGERVMTPRESVLAVVTGSGRAYAASVAEDPGSVIEVEPELGRLELELARRRARRA